MGRKGRLVAVAVAVAGTLLFAAAAAAQEPAPEAPGGEQPAPEPAPDEPSAGGGKRPHVVRVGMLINDIQQLDLQTKSYAVDLYIWFKWDDPGIDPSRSFEFLNPYQLWGHIRGYAGIRPETLPDGTRYSSLHVQGQFNSNLAVDDYPFDRQELIVAIEDKSKDESALVYAPDKEPIAVSPDISIPGWDIGEASLEVVSNQYPTDFGDAGAAADTYSRVIGTLEVTRPPSTYSLKLLLPMLLVVLSAALALSVHPRYVEGRIGIGITALLTMVALQLTSDAGLPDVNNLILLDKLYILSYVFVVLTLAAVVRASRIERFETTGEVAAAMRTDRRSLVFLTAAYVVSYALILVINLA